MTASTASAAPDLASQDPDWWRGAVIYEAYVRSFRDTNGDGVGDLAGVAEKLDYIAGLGVDALWLSPFYKSPQKDFGYDISDFRLVDPSAGTMEDFMAVLDGAHQRGMKLLLDFIPAHTSDQHPWFVESRTDRNNARADWYVWADKAPDGGPPNNWLSSFGGSSWQWEPRRAQYYYHPFLTCQPALNLRNPALLEHLLTEMEYWLDLGVDGFRLDAVQCLSYDPDLRSNPPVGSSDPQVLIGGGPANPFGDQLHQFDRNAAGTDAILRKFRKMADRYGAVLIGELADVDSSRVAVEYTSENEKLHAVYDFDLINCKADVDALTEMIRIRADHLGNGWLYNVFSNHDSKRAVSNLTGFALEHHRGQAAKMLLFMQMTLHGGCSVFQGEELGLPHPELTFEKIHDPWAKAFWPVFAGRDGARTPMPWTGEEPHAGFTDGPDAWLPVPEEHRTLNVHDQQNDPESVLNFVQAFAAWRKDKAILRRGEEVSQEAERAPLITWRRKHGAQEWRIIVNFSEDQAFMPLESGWEPLDAPGCTTNRTDHGLLLEALEFAIVTQ